jgi:hypothetical protein
VEISIFTSTKQTAIQKLNDFFEKSHLILVFIFLSLFSAIVTYGLLSLIGGFGKLQISAPMVFMGSLALGAIMGVMFTSMIHLMRKAQQFYQDCNILEDRVKSAQTREELGELFQNDFKALKKRAFHEQMHYRLREIHTRMQTMVGFLPKTSE